MTAPWIEIDEARTRDGEDYVVALEARQASGISPSVFVHVTGSGRFSHVAVADEMDALPASREEALRTNRPRYRAMSLSVRFATPREVGAFIDHARARLLELTQAWPGASDYAEPGTSRYVITADEAGAL